jgi:hypothetical protein
MQSKKLNKGEDSMKTCQIMLFGVGIAVLKLDEKLRKFQLWNSAFVCPFSGVSLFL